MRLVARKVPGIARRFGAIVRPSLPVVVALSLLGCGGTDDSAEVALETGPLVEGAVNESQLAAGASSFLGLAALEEGGLAAVRVVVDGAEARTSPPSVVAQDRTFAGLMGLELPGGDWLISATGCARADDGACEVEGATLFRLADDDQLEELGTFAELTSNTYSITGAVSDTRIVVESVRSLESSAQSQFWVVDLVAGSIEALAWVPPPLPVADSVDEGPVGSRASCVTGSQLTLVDTIRSADTSTVAMTTVDIEDSRAGNAAPLAVDGIPKGILCHEDNSRTVIALDQDARFLSASILDDAGKVAHEERLDWPAELNGLAFAPSSVTAVFATTPTAAERARGAEDPVDGPGESSSVIAFAASAWIQSPVAPARGERTFVSADGKSFAAIRAPFEIRAWAR